MRKNEENEPHDEKALRRERFFKKKAHEKQGEHEADRPRRRYKRNFIDYGRLLDEDDLFDDVEDMYDDY